MINTPTIFRLACTAALWLLLCFIVVSSQPLSPRVIFIVVASGIVVFVPLYKKYFKNGKSDGTNQSR